jgi:hypothetical protein
MLVCREWYHIAAVWMYESLVVRLLYGNNVDKLIETFETPRGAELAKLVKRIDIETDVPWGGGEGGVNYKSLLFIRFLDRHCPNAEIFALWDDKAHPCSTFSTRRMRKTNVLLVSHLKSDPATIAAAQTWRCLRIIEDSSSDLSPPFSEVTFSRGFERLERLTATFGGRYIKPSPLLANLRYYPIVSLTHLTIILRSSWGVYNVPSVCDFLRQFGNQLRFFALVVDSEVPSIEAKLFKYLLSLIPNVKELSMPPCTPFPIVKQYWSVKIFGSSLGETWESYVTFVEFINTAKWIFPSLKIIRLIRPITPWPVRRREAGMCEDGNPCANMRGIRVEDKTGRDIRPLLGCICGSGVHVG